MGKLLSRTFIGPQSHGKRMSLRRFAHAKAEPGFLYELERGVVQVVDIPGVPHERVKQQVRDELVAYRRANPDRVFLVADGSGSVIRMPELESERHPDLAVYCNPPPTEDEQSWDHWTPDLVIEIVSKQSRRRDYVIKRDDYLAAGVRLYWVIDPLTRTATVFTRRGDSCGRNKLERGGVIRTGVLPGFELRLRFSQYSVAREPFAGTAYIRARRGPPNRSNSALRSRA